MSNYTTVPLKPSTADELHELKRRGESWDELFRRVAALDGSE